MLSSLKRVRFASDVVCKDTIRIRTATASKTTHAVPWWISDYDTFVSAADKRHGAQNTADKECATHDYEVVDDDHGNVLLVRVNKNVTSGTVRDRAYCLISASVSDTRPALSRSLVSACSSRVYKCAALANSTFVQDRCFLLAFASTADGVPEQVHSSTRTVPGLATPQCLWTDSDSVFLKRLCFLRHLQDGMRHAISKNHKPAMYAYARIVVYSAIQPCCKVPDLCIARVETLSTTTTYRHVLCTFSGALFMQILDTCLLCSAALAEECIATYRDVCNAASVAADELERRMFDVCCRCACMLTCARPSDRARGTDMAERAIMLARPREAVIARRSCQDDFDLQKTVLFICTCFAGDGSELHVCIAEEYSACIVRPFMSRQQGMWFLTITQWFMHDYVLTSGVQNPRLRVGTWDVLEASAKPDDLVFMKKTITILPGSQPQQKACEYKVVREQDGLCVVVALSDRGAVNFLDIGDETDDAITAPYHYVNIKENVHKSVLSMSTDQIHARIDVATCDAQWMRIFVHAVCCLTEGRDMYEDLAKVKRLTAVECVRFYDRVYSRLQASVVKHDSAINAPLTYLLSQKTETCDKCEQVALEHVSLYEPAISNVAACLRMMFPSLVVRDGTYHACFLKLNDKQRLYICNLFETLCWSGRAKSRSSYDQALGSFIGEQKAVDVTVLSCGTRVTDKYVRAMRTFCRSFQDARRDLVYVEHACERYNVICILSLLCTLMARAYSQSDAGIDIVVLVDGHHVAAVQSRLDRCAFAFEHLKVHVYSCDTLTWETWAGHHVFIIAGLDCDSSRMSDVCKYTATMSALCASVRTWIVCAPTAESNSTGSSRKRTRSHNNNIISTEEDRNTRAIFDISSTSKLLVERLGLKRADLGFVFDVHVFSRLCASF